MKTTLIQTLQAFNAGRDPERLAMKYERMRSNAFAFLRGSCHLFYGQLPDAGVLRKAPLAWVCGDLHLENFGSYKGDNRLSYFDLNDFDEAALAPASWDLLRFVTSVQVAASSLRLSAEDALTLGDLFLHSYSEALATGKSRWIERDTAQGAIGDLLNTLGERKRSVFLDKRTELKGKQRRFLLDGKKTLPVSDMQRAKVEQFVNGFAQTQSRPEFYQVLDVARRIAGTGSLGVERYAVLVAGKGKPDSNYLLDMKAAQASSLTAHLKVKQPKWLSHAHRIVSLQQRAQAVPMAFLQAVQMGKKPFVLRGLQPSEDRLALELVQQQVGQLRQVIETMGQMLAWSHLRCAGHAGSAIADELSDWGCQDGWQTKLLRAAQSCTRQVREDWTNYCHAFDDGFFTVK